MAYEAQVGEVVGSHAHPGQSYTVLELGVKNRMMLVRAADGRELWLSTALAKAIAQPLVQD